MQRRGQPDGPIPPEEHTHILIRMSLSKPFPVSRLSLVALENVLLQTEPKDLLLFALSSEKARQLLRKCSLAEYLDINVKKHCEITFTFRLKSGKLMKWSFEIDRSILEESIISVFELDDMRMFLCENDNGVGCELPKDYYLDYTQRIGYFLQSIFPCQRIRKFGAGNLGWDFEKVFFHMDRITECEKFRFLGYEGDNLLEILEKTDVKRKITLKYDSLENSNNIDWMDNEKIRNIPNLKLAHVRNLTCSQFLSLQNEQLEFFHCEVNGSDVNEYLKKWVNGEFTKRRTLAVTENMFLNEYRFDDTVWDGLPQEPVETWEKLEKPRHVRFSDKLYLNPTPSAANNSSYRTVLLKNCRGQFATVVQTYEEFFFTPWDHPVPPIKIPKGHELWESSGWPIRCFFKTSISQIN